MKIIFYHLSEINELGKTASSIRPYKICRALNACESVNELYLVDGSIYNRLKKNFSLLFRIIKGDKFDFLYFENSNMPTALSAFKNNPFLFFFDYLFFYIFYLFNIKMTIFYRDAHWRSSELNKYGFLKKKIFDFFHILDIYFIKYIFDIIYLPDMAMLNILPEFSSNHVKSLPPGTEPKNIHSKLVATDNLELNILYVGGLSKLYRIDKLISVVSNNPNIKLMVCTRNVEYLNYVNNGGFLPENVEFIFKSENELNSYYHESDLCAIYIEPTPYWELTLPYKLFEYISYGKPIICTSGTAVSKFIEDNNIGWAIDFDSQKLSDFLAFLNDNRNLLHDKKPSLSFIEKNSWSDRVKQLLKDVESL